MPNVAVVAFYAGLYALIVFALALLVVRQRGKTSTDLGHGGHSALEQATRAHGNATEYVPIILLLILILALGGLGTLWLHILGIGLTVGRLFHAWGLSTKRGRSPGRAVGISLTWLAMLLAIIWALRLGVAAL